MAFARGSDAVGTASQSGVAATALPKIKTRSWPGLTVCSITRPAREMQNKGTEHRLNLQIAPVPNATVQVESGKPHRLTISGISFVPAGVTVRTVMGAGTVIGVLQSPACYEDVAAELTAPAAASFEPVWSMTDPVLAKLIRLLLAEIDTPFQDHLAADAINRAIAVQLVRGVVGHAARLATAGKLARDRLARVLDYIESRLDEPLTLAEIAAEANLSPFHFSRSFKRTLGISLANYVARRRIERASTLLLQSRQPLAGIALAVGFESQASFTRRFQRETGLSPGRFRKER
jgi:AraC family transcriptional regulator